VIEELVKKLHPVRFPNMSAMMAGIIGCLLGKEWSDPVIEEMIVTSDKCLLARNRGDVGFNSFLGALEDFTSNLGRLVEMQEVGLSPKEQELVWSLVSEKIKRI